MPRNNTSKGTRSNGPGLKFEAQLWAAADKMRGHMDASEYTGARPEGPRQSAVQHERLGRRTSATGHALEIRISPMNNSNYAWIPHHD